MFARSFQLRDPAYSRTQAQVCIPRNRMFPLTAPLCIHVYIIIALRVHDLAQHFTGLARAPLSFFDSP